MSSIGPQLPPQLAKRKASNDVSHDPPSPPCKRQAASSHLGYSEPIQSHNNADEVTLNLDSNSNDNVQDKNKDISHSRTSSHTPPFSSRTEPDSSRNPDTEDSPAGLGSGKQSRVFGPTLPPTTQCASQSAADSGGETSSDSEDDYQPPLPPTIGIPAQSHLCPQAPQSLTAPLYEQTLEKRPQRDDWMLAPPTSADQRTCSDPTKLRNRKFRSGPTAKSANNQVGVSTMWTETADEKLRRLEDEVLGRCPVNAAATGSKTSTAQARRENREAQATEERIQAYNKQNRNKSLLAEREAAQGRGELTKEDADDPSQRGFDREKDMALRGYIGQGKRQELLNRAAGFGSRFQKGSYL
ncbi:unnamed protein product [Blumeria hordei]|uniref:DUF3752 domain-containing protein n=2 Tax=Blumeria hordei TaxID=2867405 RepID=A0A383URC4_BLUHO|nr:hypothetical protein BGHDH14_bgh05538 [Blumeria hordei DH14]SZF01900.1 unnamed protein product [Blumeria hordei]